MQQKFNRLLILAGSLIWMNNALAVEVVDKKLEIYGKVHLSIDSSDQDDSSVTNDGISISNNSSRLGFKGELPAGDLTMIYQYEQGVNLDSGSGSLVTRNSFGGIKGNFGKVIVGHHDTPYKKLGSKWGVFSDTVGDRRTIMGASYSDGNQLNERAKNAILYEFKNKSIWFQAMYAVDGEVGSADTGGVDNNDITMSGLLFQYKLGSILIGLANETWEGHSKAGDVDALRAAVSYMFGKSKVGFIYETIDSSTDSQWNRDAMGVNVKFDMGNGDIRAHYLIADSAEGATDTGATNLSLGYFHKLDKSKQVYLAYSSTDNDPNAKFKGVDGGHGDEVATTEGGSPSSISAGMVFKF